jgi:O-Antigen ligase
MARTASEGSQNRVQPARPIQDTIGRTLIVIFLFKPLIDLFPQAAIWVGPIRLAPTTVIGVLLFFWLVRFLFNRGRLVPPFGRLFEAFIVINALSLIVSLISGTFESMPLTVAWVFKILDAYVVFSCAYLAAQRHQYTDITPFLTAMVVGGAIVVVLNVLAINLGMTGILASNEGFDAFSGGRERGLYFDPGVLANVAFNSLILTVFRYHLARSARPLWLVFTVVIVLCDLYLVIVAQSRAGMILIAVFGVIYLSLFQQSWGKILAPIVAVGVIAGTLATMEGDLSEILSRFEGDVAALEESEKGGNVGVTSSGRVSLGRYEALGSNRGMVWAEALSDIVQRPLIEILIGNYSFSKGGHSDYIDALSRNGVLGLIVFVWLIVGLVFRTWSLARSAGAGHGRVLHYLAFVLILCFALYAIPFRPLGYTTTAWYMWTLLGFSLAWSARRVTRTVTVPPRTARDAPAEPDDGSEAEQEPAWPGPRPVNRR